MARLLSERLRETHLAKLNHKQVAARQASQVLRLVKREGVGVAEDHQIHTRYTYAQLARLIGSKRVPVSRASVDLKEEGAEELRERKIHAADLGALK